MKQKNYKWIIYIGGILILGLIGYIAAKDITPITRQVEKNVELNLGK